MNFYKHHIGDYASATEHLSWDEDQAYTRLMRVYYRDEKPLPDDIPKVMRLARASTTAQKRAVEAVLEEFFDLREDGWHQSRCDEEISIAQSKADHNREVGKKGGRPRKTETQWVLFGKPTNNPTGLISEPKHNPIQTPDSRNQTPEPHTHSESGLYADLRARIRANGSTPGAKAKAESRVCVDEIITEAKAHADR